MEQTARSYPDDATDSPTSSYDVLAPGYYAFKAFVSPTMAVNPLTIEDEKKYDVIVVVQTGREWTAGDALDWLFQQYHIHPCKKCPLKKADIRETEGKRVYVLGDK